ncbi:MAG: efflux RND transporter periplasmic adaptor subunit [Acidobacteria bacterium]|nr:efflux RND transporter periplasmic adaptor subunit [Acidobacteriota bacterium]
MMMTTISGDAQDGKQLARLAPPPCMFLLGALLALSACQGPPVESAAVASPPKMETPSNEVVLSTETIELARIRSAAVETAQLGETIEVPARIMLDEDRTVRVGSFVEGVIRECCLGVGSAVKKDQVLARLHSHSGHDAESDYLQALAEVQRRVAEREYAEQAHNRASRLHELKAGSLQDLQEASAELERAETAVTHAHAEVQRTEHHLNFLGLPLPDVTAGATPASGSAASENDGDDHDHLIAIRSPQDGTVMERLTSEGAVVTPSDAVYVISDLSRLWAIAQVPERHLRSVRGGMQAELRVEAYPGRVFPARITRIADSLDPESRTVQVRCVVSNPRRELKTEMFATVSIPVGETAPVTAVPLAALQPIDGVDTVFVELSAGRFEARPIAVGRRSATLAEVTGGLDVGERIVVEGAFHVKSEHLKSRMSEE